MSPFKIIKKRKIYKESLGAMIEMMVSRLKRYCIAESFIVEQMMKIWKLFKIYFIFFF
jgi:hypothetical protein